MADVYGVNYTKTNTPTPSNKLANNVSGGRVKYIFDSYECAAAAKGTVIYVGKLPEGSVLLPQSRVEFDNLGSNTAIAVGTVASPASFAASAATTSAGSLNLDVIGNVGEEMSAATDVVITVSGAGAATNTIKVSLMYSVM